MSLPRKLISKTLNLFITVFLVMTLNFCLFRVMPGDPARILFSHEASVSPDIIAKWRHFYGLDKSVWAQYIIYLCETFAGKLGYSYVWMKPVEDVIWAHMVPTLILMGTSMIFTTIFGTLMGILSAWKRGRLVDKGLLLFNITLFAVPTFLLGIVLLTLLAVHVPLFPVGGFLTPWGKDPLLIDILRHLFLPAATLSLTNLATFFLITRGSLIDVLKEDYITLARAKGLTERNILTRHAIPNAILPLVTKVAMNLGFIVGGAVQVEIIFSYPGIGYLAYQSAIRRGFPVLQGIFLIITISVVLANYVADLIYTKLDPRVRV